MRITGGILKGRLVLTPKTKLRPTQDKVRQALFSSLGSIIQGCAFLDLFAGSGSVGLEAAGRGATQVCMVELDRHAVSVIHKNLESLFGNDKKTSDCRIAVLNRDVFRYVSKTPESPFNVVYADPPYNYGYDQDRMATLLRNAGNSGLLQAGGVFILEQSVKAAVQEPAGWQLIKQADYGQARLCYYKEKK